MDYVKLKVTFFVSSSTDLELEHSWIQLMDSLGGIGPDESSWDNYITNCINVINAFINYIYACIKSYLRFNAYAGVNAYGHCHSISASANNDMSNFKFLEGIRDICTEENTNGSESSSISISISIGPWNSILVLLLVL